jgi:hypothetical protein
MLRKQWLRWINKSVTVKKQPLRKNLQVLELEDRSVPATVAFPGGFLQIGLDSPNEAVTVNNDGTNITVTTTGTLTGVGTYSTAALQAINVTDLFSDVGQSINFTGSAFSVPSGFSSIKVETVNFNAAVTATGTSSISVNAPQNIVVNASLTGGSGGVSLTGQGTAALNTVGVAVQSGAIVTATGSGPVSVTGTGGSAASASNFGVLVENSGQITSGGGNVTVEGFGGGGTGGGDDNFGVLVRSAAQITSGGAGTVTVTGTGGSGSGNFNQGVLVTDGSSLITSGGAGTVSVTGTGGSGAGDNNLGVLVRSGAQITSGGVGTVGVTGFGGPGSGSSFFARNYGVAVDGTNSTITSGGGNVSVQGTGGNGKGNFDHGVVVQNAAKITSGGNASVTVLGNGGNGTVGAGNDNDNYGVSVESAGQITSGGSGLVSVTGIAGSGVNSNIGIYVQGVNSTITSGGGNVSVSGQGAGSGAGNSGIGLRVNAGQITSGGNGTVTVQGTGGTTTGGALVGVFVENAGTITTGGSGTVSVTGTGGSGPGNLNVGVYLFSSGQITSGGGAVSVTATGNTNTIPAEALRLEDSGAITSGTNAPISITADSVNLFSGTSINSGTGTTTIRTRSIGAGVDLGGSDVLSGSLKLGLSAAELNQITAGTLVIGRNSNFSGPITVSSNVAPTGTSNLSLRTQSNITGSGGITIPNLALSTVTGVNLTGPNAATNLVAVSTVSGGITFNNTSTDLTLSNTAIDGVAGITATGQALSFSTTTSGNIDVNTPLSGSTISLNSAGNLNSNATGTLTGSTGTTLANAAGGTLVGIISGGTLSYNGTGVLTLSGNNTYTGTTSVNAGTLLVNGIHTGTGATTVASGATLGGSGKLPGNVTINAGGFIAPGNSPGILNTGNYNQAGTLDAEVVRPLATTIAGTDYDQVNVTGTVSLSGSLNLIFSGTGSIPDAKQLVLINNDGTDAVTGTFSNYTINGGTFTADGRQWVIFYNGGTGNDVTITSVGALAPAAVYVNDNWASLTSGSMNFSSQFSDEIFGYNAFSTVAAALAKVATGGTVVITGGTYAGTYTVSDGTLTIRMVTDIENSQLTVNQNGAVTLAAGTTFTLGGGGFNPATTIFNSTITGTGKSLNITNPTAQAADVKFNGVVSVNGLTVSLPNSNDQLFLGANITTAGGAVNLTAGKGIVAANSISVTTAGGNAIFNSPDIYSEINEFNDLTIDTSSTTAGNVTITGNFNGYELVNFSDLVNDLLINAKSSSGADGLISFTKVGGIGIFLQSKSGDAASVTLQGDVRLSSVTNIDVGNNQSGGVNSGSVDLSQSQISGTVANVNLVVSTRTYGTGPLVSSSGNIDLGYFGSAGGHQLLLVETFAQKNSGSAPGNITINKGRTGNTTPTDAGGVGGNFLAWGGIVTSNANMSAETTAVVAAQIVDGNMAATNFTGNNLLLQSKALNNSVSLQTSVNSLAAQTNNGDITISNDKLLNLSNLTYTHSSTDLPSSFTTNGIVALSKTVDLTAAGLTQSILGTVVADQLRLQGTGNFTLNGNNDVNVIAAAVNGNLSFNDSDDLTIGTVLGTDGISTTAATNGTVAVTAGDVLFLAKNVATKGGSINLTSTGVNAEIILKNNVAISSTNGATTGGNVTLNSPWISSENLGFYDLTINTSAMTGGNVTISGEFDGIGPNNKDVGDLLINAKGASPVDDGVILFQTSGAGINVRSTAGDQASVTLQGNVQITGNGLLIDAASYVPGVSSGFVDLGDARISSNSTNGSLYIYTEYAFTTPANAGDITLPYFGNAAGNKLFTVELYAGNNSTGTAGTVTFTQGRPAGALSDAGAIGADLFVQGGVINSNAGLTTGVSSNLVLLSKSGIVDGNGTGLNFAAPGGKLQIQAAPGSGNISLDTNVGSVAASTNGSLTLNNGSALLVESLSYTFATSNPSNVAPGPISTSGINTSGNAVTLNNTGLVTINQPITATGATVDINSQGATQNVPGLINAANLRLQGNGNFTLPLSNNLVNGGSAGTFAAAVTGNLNFKNAGVNGLTVGTVLGTNGITVSGTGNTATLESTKGLTASQAITAPGNVNVSYGTANTTGYTGLVNAAITSQNAHLVINAGTGPDTLTANAALSGAASVTVNLGDGSDQATFNSPVSSSAGSIAINGGGGDDTITVNAAITATPLTAATIDGGTGSDIVTILGTSGADTYDINKTIAKTAIARGGQFQYVGVETMNLNGANDAGGSADNDTFLLGFDDYVNSTGYLPPQVNLFAGAGTDAATIWLPAGNNFDANNSSTKINWGGNSTAYRNNGSYQENVTYTPNLEQLTLEGNTGRDWVYARPSSTAQKTLITVNGDTPTSPAGDRLQLEVIGLTAGIVTTAATIPSGQLTGPALAKINWTGIESLPVPLGLGGSFDFGSATSPIQETGIGTNADAQPTPPNEAVAWTRVTGVNTFTTGANANIYGWDGVVNDFVRWTGGVNPLPTGPNRDLLQDGAYWASGPANKRNFQVAVAPGGTVQVTVFAGDQAPVGGTKGDLYIEGTKVDSYSVLNGKFYTNRFTVTDVGNDGIINVSFYQPMLDSWSLANAVDVRPIEWIAPVYLVRDDANTKAVGADGIAIDKYNLSNAQPNQTFTVTASQGTLVNADGSPMTDADTSLNGTQFTVNASGNASIYLRRPTGITSSNIDIFSAYGDAKLDGDGKGTGAPFGPFVQTYFTTGNPPIPISPAPTSRQFDFNSTTNVTQTGFTPVAWNQLFSPSSSKGNGVGWLEGTVGFFDRGTTSTGFGGTANLNRDGQASQSARTFVTELTPDTSYTVTIFLGDPAPTALRPGMTVSVGNNYGTMLGSGSVVTGSPSKFAVDPALPYSPVVGAGTAYFTNSTVVNGVTLPAGTFVVSPSKGGTIALQFQAMSSSTGLLGIRLGTTNVAPNWWSAQGITFTPGTSVERLMPQEGALIGSDAAKISSDDLQPVLQQAISIWSGAGLDSDLVGKLSQVKATVQNLEGGELGQHTAGMITIDDDGAGRGWSTGSEVAKKEYDLLTVVMHELGHELGLKDLPNTGSPTLMTESLPTGERRMATDFEVEAAEELVTLTPAPTSEIVELSVAVSPEAWGPAPSQLFVVSNGQLHLAAHTTTLDEVSLHGVQLS